LTIHGENWTCGDMIIATSDHTRRWATKHAMERAEPLRYLRAPRTARLPKPKTTTISPKDSRYD